MRTFQRARFARRFLAVCVLAPGALLLQPLSVHSASPSGVPQSAATQARGTTAVLQTFSELQAKLDEGDQIATLHALHMALNRVGDGATFAWKKNNKDLRGVIKPTSVFRNANGQICRHVIYALSLGPYRKQIEFIACREAGGRWRL